MYYQGSKDITSQKTSHWLYKLLVIRDTGRWNSDCMKSCYLTKFLLTNVEAFGCFNVFEDDYFIKHTTIDSLQELSILSKSFLDMAQIKKEYIEYMLRKSTAGIERSHRAILFPGQGSQYVGMGKDLYNLYPRSAKLVFDEADEALGNGLRALIFEGQQEKLKLTENAQPAILTTSIAMLRVLETEFGFDIAKACNHALGHSLGEYTALVATKALSLTDAVRLVRLRGEAMTRAVADRQGKTAMSALVVRKDKLSELLKAMEEIKTILPKDELVSVANINSSFQVVISGTSQGVDQASRILQERRFAARAVDLPVSAPFHCSLMQEAADVMEDALKKVKFNMPCVEVVSNVTAKPYTSAEEIPKYLVEQVVAPVEWERSINYCKSQDIDDFLCFGPEMGSKQINQAAVKLETISTASAMMGKSGMPKEEDAIEVKLEKVATISATDLKRARYVHTDPYSFKGRIGYACMNTVLRAQKPSIFCSRTCRLDTVMKKGLEYVKELALANVADLKKMIQWNEDNKIRFMRMSSEMFPFASHEKAGYEIDFAKKELAEAGALAKEYNHRLTMHPGQYNQLVSLTPKVVSNTIRELHYHAHMMDLMDLDQDSVMIMIDFSTKLSHMGGVYGDREAALARFEEEYVKLPEHIKRRLVLENDEFGYSVSDLLPICQKLQIPLVLDWHHHHINPGTVTDLVSLLPTINKIWTDKGIKPKQHYSESRKGAVSAMEMRAHSDRVKYLPPTTDDVDLMIEAKDKEQAVLQLYKTYNLETVNDDVWIPQTGTESTQTKGRKSTKSVAKKSKAIKEEKTKEGVVVDYTEEVTEVRRTSRRSAAVAAKRKMLEEEVRAIEEAKEERRLLEDTKGAITEDRRQNNELFKSNQHAIDNIQDAIQRELPNLIQEFQLNKSEIDDLNKFVEDKVDDISLSSLTEHFFNYDEPFVYFHKTDKTYRPVLIIHLAYFSKYLIQQYDLSEFLTPLIIFVLETARKLTWDMTKDRIKSNVENPVISDILVFVDFKKASTLPTTDINLLKSFVSLLRRYPGVVGTVNLLNFGWMYQGLWQMCKLVLSTDAKAKVNFPKLHALQDLVEQEDLLAEFGGKDMFKWTLHNDSYYQKYQKNISTRPPSMMSRRSSSSSTIYYDLYNEDGVIYPSSSIAFSMTRPISSLSNSSYVTPFSSYTNLPNLSNKQRRTEENNRHVRRFFQSAINRLPIFSTLSSTYYHNRLIVPSNNNNKRNWLILFLLKIESTVYYTIRKIKRHKTPFYWVIACLLLRNDVIKEICQRIILYLVKTMLLTN
ncbi:MAG: UV-endonuclease UvdE-domain-containing protein [Benjaminiella poitrasii]|nr:MAG: UV-endonuclease UvdE-domain-containing protein [Benjaminiella poitrasii]